MQTITRCHHCGEFFGTRAALSIHHPGNCRSEKTMQRAGAWRGWQGVWWTPDLGLDDETEDRPESHFQVIENTGRKLGQNGVSRVRPRPGILSKFPGVPA